MIGVSQVIDYESLETADLRIDAIYKGGNRKNAGDDPLIKLLSCGNSGGFRVLGSVINSTVKLCGLYTSLSDMEWPDRIDVEAGQFIYYGDNKTPGRDLHDTYKKGNLLLRDSFNNLHNKERKKIPPFFVFSKGPEGRDVIFRGLAVPGAIGVNATEDLVAVWKTADGQRFQNYKATFTILDVDHITRAWLDDIKAGNPFSENAHPNWIEWVNGGEYKPLIAPKTRHYRTKEEQLPSNKQHDEILRNILNYFKNHSQREYAFEKCAAELARMMDGNIVSYDLTRPWRDGGRDAIGIYRIGTEDNAVHVEFALEAKCKDFNNGSGVEQTSRLISRLRYRQFGIFVTTSYVSQQAYSEILEDGHPVIIVCAEDIAKILIDSGYSTREAVQNWLESNFP